MDTLPSEIITQILEYLPFNDRRELATVNKLFYHASSHPVFLRKELFTYGPHVIDLSSYNDFKKMLRESKRKLFCLRFINFMFINDPTIFTNLGHHIISLQIYDTSAITDSVLDTITLSCDNLEQLELTRVDHLILTDPDRKPLLKLCSITLNSIHMTDRNFNLILNLAPNLKNLSILDCDLIGEDRILQRFYPYSGHIDNSFIKYDSNDIFSTYNVLYHLNGYIRLNSLQINYCSFIFYEMQPIQLEMKSLSLNVMQTMYSQTFNYEKFNLVLNQYVFLQQLEILYLPVNLFSIISKLYNLRHLTISYAIGDMNATDIDKYMKSFMESLQNLKYIRTLSFYRGFDTLSDFEVPIYPLLECTLKSLTSLDCSLDSILGILKFCKNLTSLQIRNGNILTVEDLQLLFRNFTNLKHLQIDNCSILNDEIFIELPISNLKELVSLKIIPTNISHRCLRHIKNFRLRVLNLTEVSLEPCSTQEEINEFNHSIKILSRAVPKLTQVIIRVQNSSMRKITTSDYLSYFLRDFKLLLSSYFKSLIIFKIY